mmetsp:Transcript_30216/g.100041  ORF Transcript_30216/g.100041 Transcript_30216/m.100041 type:complete len:1060 (-) Transcript_30216:13-3192(-)
MPLCCRCNRPIHGCAYTTPALERVHWGCRDAADADDWLRPWLESMDLEHHLPCAVAWADMEKAKGVQDVRRDFVALSDFLELDEHEHERLAEACGATLIALTTSSSSRTRSSLEESFDLACHLGVWLDSLQLSHHFETSLVWCESVGATDLEDVCRRWEDFAGFLELDADTRSRLAESCRRERPRGLLKRVVSEVAELEAAEDEPACDAPCAEWLRAWLRSLRLVHRLVEAAEWCEFMGAADVEEVLENWEDFTDALHLENGERERLARAAGVEVEHKGREEKEGFERGVSEGRESAPDTSDAVGDHAGKNWLRSWLFSLRLQHHLAEAAAWCDEMGAADVEEVAESWEELADHLGLVDAERSCLESGAAAVRAPGGEGGGGRGLGQAMRTWRGGETDLEAGVLPTFYSDPSLSSRAKGASDQFGPPENPYTILNKLGSGATATVYRCCRNEEYFAVKVIHLQKMRMQQQYSHILRILSRETSLLLALRHDKIVQLRDVFETPDQLYLVLDLVEGGDLYDHIVSNGRMQEDHSRYVLAQLVDALMYIHSKNIVHRDLKLDNILIDSVRSHPGCMEVKVADFGHSKSIRDGYTQALTACGTPQYWAPEQQKAGISGSYDERVDIWSLGVVLYAMLTGTLPFDSTAASQSAKFKFRGSRQAEELLRGLIRVAPEHRMSLEEVLKSPWVLQGNAAGVPQSLGSSNWDAEKAREEFRTRLPRAPSDLKRFQSDLSTFARKHHVPASLRMLEVVVIFPNADDGNSVEAAKKDLYAILKSHFTDLEGMRKLRTLRSFDENTAALWAEEQKSLEAIYQQDFEVLGTAYWQIRLCKDAVLRIELPSGYPQSVPPSVVLVGSECQVGGLIKTLAEEWLPGEACIFGWAEEIARRALPEAQEHQAQSADVGQSGSREECLKEQLPPRIRIDDDGNHIYEPRTKKHRDAPRSVRDGQKLRVWDDESLDPAHAVELYHGEVVEEKKSKFQAHFAKVVNMGEVKWAHRELLSDDKLATATHNTIAYQFYDYTKSTQVLDYDDDHENGAGKCPLASTRVSSIQKEVQVNDLQA